TMPTRLLAATLLLCQLLSAGLPARAQQPTPTPQTPAQGQAARPALDPNDPVARIMDEGMNRSQVMQILSQLTDVIGPRLTNSPQMKRANEWTRDQMLKWGMQNARLEPWGPFGRGWSLRRFSAEVVAPQGFPVIAYPKAWSPGTPSGPLTAEVVHLDAADEQGLEKYRGRLRGKIVLTGPPREVRAHFDPQGTRLTEKQLLDLANAPDPAQRARRPQQQQQATPEQRAQFRFNNVRLKFLHDEGAALLVDPGRGDGGNLFVSSASVPPREVAPLDAPPNPNAPRTPSAYSKDAPAFAPQIVMAIEHYNRLVRMLRAGVAVTMAVNLDVQFHGEDLMGYNTVAEIPGTDLKDEVVMLGGHMDSWHGGTGATDNAAGVAVAMEAARIIQSLGLKPRRTIRVGLWSGEEQGLLGSRAYVKEHFGEIVTPTPQPTPPGTGEGQPVAQPTPTPQGRLVTKPAYEKFSAYFNLDNGTGRIRGVYLQGNEAVRPIFRQWLQPFGEMGAQTLSISNTGGTDHIAFDAIGLPGFQFIQDQIEYSTRTHHSTQDVYDRLQADDMKQAATVMAAFVYQTAMRDEKLPRKPAPGAR
ncbi:MAG TPA: M20/M25/M40 family metallo-hydrolase, partial [Pyrinomonadaceae bacterium]|nr:M20/M25/M40 family metallo-hydrolase [Pyrinomonadaceae bacterium]